MLRGPLWWSLFEEVWQVTARSLLPIQRWLELNYEREGEECLRTSHWMETWSGFGGAGCLLILVCDKMTLNQTLGRIFKMLEAMSRQPCGPIASARCCCSDVTLGPCLKEQQIIPIDRIAGGVKEGRSGKIAQFNCLCPVPVDSWYLFQGCVSFPNVLLTLTSGSLVSPS